MEFCETSLEIPEVLDLSCCGEYSQSMLKLREYHTLKITKKSIPLGARNI
jgi:hypothetical protein